MKNLTGLSFILLIVLLQISCKQTTNLTENLLTVIPYVEDSIIYNVPDAPRLCDEMKVEKQYVNIGDCKLYCEIEGDGIPLVLIHGGPGGTHHCFHPWLSGAKDKFKIIYYDQRGCGLSDFNAGDGYSFEQTINDLENLRIALKIDQWIVLGHSFGGAVAQYYTIKYPQNVIGQILVASVPMINKPEINAAHENHFLNEEEIQKLDEILQFVYAGKLTYSQYFYNNDINGGWKRQNFLKPTKERQAQLAKYDIVFDPVFNSDYALYDFEHAFDNCPIPTLLCEGKYDSLWSAIKVPMMIKNHPNAEYRSFEYSSHNIYRDEPEVFIDAIADWAESLKIADNKEINDWKIHTKEVLSDQIDLINNNRLFTKLVRTEGVDAAKKYYKNFKINNPEKILFFENSIIRLGYNYLNLDKTEEAITLFEMNAKENHESWNAYDCLGEAYLKAGNNALAIENYEKSVKLNPENKAGIEALENLKKLIFN